jgi:N-acetylglucosamine-6-phosphate deacetylase
MFILRGPKVNSADSGTRPSRVLARQLFDGVSLTGVPNRVIELSDGRIVAIRPAKAEDHDDPDVFSADVVAAGFIDLQINGAGGAQFNFDPSVAALDQIAKGARQGGTAHILPTFITAPGTDYVNAITAARAAIKAGIPGILGLHLEGPFLSPQRPGIHDPLAIRPMTAGDISAITASFPGPLLLTLAPECLPEGSLEALARAGVTVFAGHSMATSRAMVEAEGRGLRGVTHLFNAMSQLTGREPGIVGAVFASEGLFAGIIADNHHVAAENLRLAAQLLPDRLCLVTDAMLTLASDVHQFTLNGQNIFLNDGRLTNAQGTLAGAHVAMDESLRNMIACTNLPPAVVLNMASRNPAMAIGLGHELGSVMPGYRASLTFLNADLKATAVSVDGLLLRLGGT